MNILYFGESTPGSTSNQRISALKRLGHFTVTINPIQLHPPLSFIQNWLHYRTGYRFLQKRLLSVLIEALNCLSHDPDVIWVDSGEHLGPEIILYLKNHYDVPIVLYNIDNPTVKRDWLRFASLRASTPFYDLCVCVRPETCLEMLSLGAQSALRVWRSYDELEHAPTNAIDTSSSSLLKSFVVFVGTYIPGEMRDIFISKLILSGLPLKIFGNGWPRSRYYNIIRQSLHGTSLQNQAYVDVLHGAGVCLGLLSHQNCDLHTTRSLEIPYAKSVLCAERTSEHQLLYEDGREALFWESWSECLSQCTRLLADSFFRESLVTAGHKRVQELGIGNEDLCRQVLATL